MSTNINISKIEKRINFARGAFGITIGLCALVTISLFGANMDAANFPGSNIKLEVYPESSVKKGQYVAVLDGYLLELPDDTAPTACSNFADNTQDGNAASEGGSAISNKLCMSTTKDKETGDLVDEDQTWNSGWISAMECARTIDTADCAPFSAWGALSIFGMLTFGLLAIQTLLFTAHTGVAMSDGDISLSTLKEIYANTTQRNILGITITWGIIGFGLFVWSALSWQSMCDKIDTGMGRIVDTSGAVPYNGTVNDHHQPACSTTGCTSSFMYFFITYALSIVWSTIPYLLVWFGLLESA